MEKIIKNLILTLTLVISISFNSCKNSDNDLTTSTKTQENVDKNQSNLNEVTKQNIEINHQTSTIDVSSTQTELDKATKAGKAVFIVVTGTGSTDTDKALSIVEGARSIYSNSIIIQMNRDDISNAQLTNQWRLSGAPLPLILVVSPKGQLTGGQILSQATSESIASLIPSPKLEEVYAAIGRGKPAFVIFSKKSFRDKSDVLKVCKEAVSLLNNNAVIVEVDIEDNKEASFMKQVRIDKSSVESSITLVLNAQGQLSGTSATIPDAMKLATAATKPVKSGCGPGCGPAGCGK